MGVVVVVVVVVLVLVVDTVGTLAVAVYHQPKPDEGPDAHNMLPRALLSLSHDQRFLSLEFGVRVDCSVGLKALGFDS